MPLDGLTLHHVVRELEPLTGGRIDKVQQPEPDEIILAVRSRGQNHKLLLTANAMSPRLHFTTLTKPNPDQAPLFCMVLRKHLVGGRITAVRQPDYERIVEIVVESHSEMGDATVKCLTVEIMGKHSNILLLDESGVILDAARHVSWAMSSVRRVLPGQPYARPPGQNKVAPDAAAIPARLPAETKPLQTLLYTTFNGISPVLASEICLRAQLAPETRADTLTDAERERLCAAFSAVYAAPAAPHIFFDAGADRKAKDFSALPLLVYQGFEAEAFPTLSALLETFYARRDTEYRIGQKTADLRKLLAGHIERRVKKQGIYEKSLAEVADRDQWQRFGEFVTAYMHTARPGADVLRVEDYYNDGAPVAIPMDPLLTPSENAQQYFKRYQKAKRTHAALQEQIVANDQDLAYLDSVQTTLGYAESENDIAQIRAELAEQGFVKRRPAKKSGAPAKPKPLHFKLGDGEHPFDAYVGKNNTQNDEITFKLARPNDLWLHTKDIAGSHVIVQTGGREVPPDVLLAAANLAAYYSKARLSAQVPVEYVARRHVKKPNGAKPGYVIYEQNRTLYVTPKEPVG